LRPQALLKVWEKLSKASKKKFPHPKESLIKVPKPEKNKQEKNTKVKGRRKLHPR
jgi:hypothetical protein